MTPALRGVQRKVWERLAADMPRDGEFRALKKAGLALEWGVRAATITAAVAALEGAGYIERGSREGRYDTYRWRDTEPMSPAAQTRAA